MWPCKLTSAELSAPGMCVRVVRIVRVFARYACLAWRVCVCVLLCGAHVRNVESQCGRIFCDEETRERERECVCVCLCVCVCVRLPGFSATDACMKKAHKIWMVAKSNLLPTCSTRSQPLGESTESKRTHASHDPGYTRMHTHIQPHTERQAHLHTHCRQQQAATNTAHSSKNARRTH